tara:strand:- start:2668 stop:2838 length:171 start_codon:yes stop_codon:yes gene_type:complete
MKYETEYYYTMIDAQHLIDSLGLSGFLEGLFTEKKSRPLTEKEKEIISRLHDQWEL